MRTQLYRLLIQIWCNPASLPKISQTVQNNTTFESACNRDIQDIKKILIGFTFISCRNKKKSISPEKSQSYNILNSILQTRQYVHFNSFTRKVIIIQNYPISFISLKARPDQSGCNIQGWIGYAEPNTCPYICPKTWLNEAGADRYI